MSNLSMQIVQHAVRKAFDAASIMVVVSELQSSEKRFCVKLHDVLAKKEHIFYVGINSTIAELEELIRDAAGKLGLVEGPDPIGTVAATGNVD